MTDTDVPYNNVIENNNERNAPVVEPARIPKAAPPKAFIVFPEALKISFVSYLGEGAYGKVYLAQDEAKVFKAVKTYDLRKMPQTYREKFIPRESNLILKMSHPNIISTQKLCRSGAFIFMVMDYAELRDLEYYIQTLCTRVIQESQARIWTRQVANGLEYLHTIGIVHRDIKCDNILINSTLNAKLADFGFTRLMKSTRDLSSTYCGTATYAAPEVIKNTPYNPRAADVWSLGVVLYRILTKSFPFGNADVRINERQRRQRAREYTFNRNYDVSVEAKQIISTMFEPNPRYRITARDVQRHPWVLSDGNCRTTPAEEEAIRLGKVKANFFQKENPKVKRITSIETTANILEESMERVWTDEAEEIISEEMIRMRVCQES